jgi:CHAD domain-containing protein
MSTTPHTALPKAKPKLGLRAWMEVVLGECDRAAVGLEVDPVHDLRVALRRCRSLADGFMAMDPDPSWKSMKKAGKKLFQALGGLRDMQVMQEWIEKVSEADNPVALRLLDHLRTREAECKQETVQDLNKFDRKQWGQWSRTLPRRSARVRPGSSIFKHLALEKWTAAYDLHKHAMRTRSQISLHELRIGIKRFRYTVENFLPDQHASWGRDLKVLQDLLGEVHDLDVLWNTAVQIGAFTDLESRSRWKTKLNEERASRIERYREKMLGKRSLWHVWRTELPSGPQMRAAALNRMRLWASCLDPDFQHSQRVSQFALQLYDGLKQVGLIVENPERDSRAVLQAASLLHDVGKAKGDKAHHKDSFRMIRSLPRPLGWSAPELELTAIVARYHRGALPRLRTKGLQILELPDRRVGMELAGILRLANALDGHNGIQPRLTVSLHDRMILVQAAGYTPLDRAAEKVAAARHLLETVLRRPILVTRLREPVRSRSAARSS